MRRVSVVGNSGSGKTRLARAIAKRLDVPFVELDGLMHQPGWQPRPDDEFMSEVERASSQPAWVIDGNYRRFVIEGPVWSKADTIVWLDLPRRTVMMQVIGRTVRRALTREELWNGNREPLSNFTSLDPATNVIVWAWVLNTTSSTRDTPPRWRILDGAISTSSDCDPMPRRTAG